MLGFTKDSAPATFRTLLKGESCRAEVYVERTPITQIPYQNEEKCAECLHKLFQEKDRIYDHFVQHDTFDGLGKPKAPSNRNYIDLTIYTIWIIIIGIPSLIWFGRFLFISTWFSKMIFAFIILIAYLIIQKLINMSVIKTDSKTTKFN